MAAITVRNLPGDVHAKLRSLASSKGSSVEALVRTTLAQASHGAPLSSGFSEMQAPWNGPDVKTSTPANLWGAMRGTVHLDPAADLSAPTGEVWKASA